MTRPNRGKQFEHIVFASFNDVDDVSINRLPDQMSGYKGSSNICDFIAYKYPHQYFIECKCCYGNTFPLTNITVNQWEGLMSKSKIKGCIAGVIIWFIDWDITVFFPINSLCNLKDEGLKSVNARNLPFYEVPFNILEGKKKRTFFKYDIKKFLNAMTEVNKYE